jgi:hypothetical protein
MVTAPSPTVASIGELVDELKRAAQAITNGMRGVTLAEQLWNEADTWYIHCLAGSGQPEEGTLAGLSNKLPGVFGEAKVLLDQCHGKIQALIDHYTGSSSFTETGQADAPKEGPYRNPNGDQFFPEAAAMAAGLPKRVASGQGDRTVAIARVNGHVIPRISSGGSEHTDDNTRAAAQLLRDSGYPPEQVEFLKYHAEIKTLAMIHQFGVRAADVAINNTPCGVETARGKDAVCDKALQRLATLHGITLTVYGTCANNQPYHKEYGRSAP